MLFGPNNFYIKLKCREEKEILFSYKNTEQLKIVSKHLEFSSGYMAVVTYPIFANMPNPVFISENTQDEFKKFLIKFYLTGVYELKLINDNDIICQGIAEVSSSFL